MAHAATPVTYEYKKEFDKFKDFFEQDAPVAEELFKSFLNKLYKLIKDSQGLGKGTISLYLSSFKKTKHFTFEFGSTETEAKPIPSDIASQIGHSVTTLCDLASKVFEFSGSIHYEIAAPEYSIARTFTGIIADRKSALAEQQLKMACRIIQDQSQTSTKEIRALQQDIIRLNEELAARKKELAETKTPKKEGKSDKSLNNLKTLLAEKEASFNKAQADLIDIKARIKKLSTEFNATKTTFSTLKATTTDKIRELGEAHRIDAAALATELREAYKTIQKDDATIIDLKKQINALDQKLETYILAANLAQRNLGDLEAEIKRLQGITGLASSAKATVTPETANPKASRLSATAKPFEPSTPPKETGALADILTPLPADPSTPFASASRSPLTAGGAGNPTSPTNLEPLKVFFHLTYGKWYQLNSAGTDLIEVSFPKFNHKTQKFYLMELPDTKVIPMILGPTLKESYPAIFCFYGDEHDPILYISPTEPSTPAASDPTITYK
jgi:hypothetical protein